MGEVLEKVEPNKASVTQLGRPDSANDLGAGKMVTAINYSAPKYVRNAIADLGRTEDIKFSPDNRRLAVAALSKNKIVIFDVCIEASPSGRTITLTDVVEISSTHIKRPHGVYFIDDEKIIVANREGGATIFELPSGDVRSNCELTPLLVIPSPDILNSPGSVYVSRKNKDIYEALICNNYVHKVTRHLLDFTETCPVKNSETLLHKWLNIPDGISANLHWIAVSNHDCRNVLLYKNIDSLN